MRIGLISAQASPLTTGDGATAGQQQRQVADLSRVLAGRGHEVRVYVRRGAGPAQPPTRVDGVVVEQVPAGPARQLTAGELLRHAGGFGRWLAKRWREGPWRPEVVHAHSWLSGLAAVTATRASAIPVVQTYHSLGSVTRRYLGDADRSPRERVGLERALGRVVDRVVAHSPDELTELAHLGLARDAVSVVPAGVDVAAFNPTGAAAPVADRPRILAVGRSYPGSGVDELVAALRLVPGAELVVAGGPAPEQLDRDPHARALRTLADRMGVAERVRLVGAVPAAQMPAWYRSAAVFACAPQCPAFGLAAVEAMACGTPVVGYALGGLTDIVVDGVTGRLIRPHDVPELGAALRHLLGSDVERLAFAEAAADRARSCYAWDRVAGELEQVYAQLSAAAGLSGTLAG